MAVFGASRLCCISREFLSAAVPRWCPRVVDSIIFRYLSTVTGLLISGFPNMEAILLYCSIICALFKFMCWESSLCMIASSSSSRIRAADVLPLFLCTKAMKPSASYWSTLRLSVFPVEGSLWG